jgi:hypothetical protein
MGIKHFFYQIYSEKKTQRVADSKRWTEIEGTQDSKNDFMSKE